MAAQARVAIRVRRHEQVKQEETMHIARASSLLIIALIGWGVCASVQASPASAGRPLTLIPTALQELNELRINTGKKAVLKDGTMSAVYVNHFPAKGSTYLNFHVDIATEAGPFDLRSDGIRLEGKTGRTETPEVVTYTPLDWFLDTGLEEVRGDPLTVKDKALLQFTIEVPKAGLDDLVLFVHSQSIGTVRSIRERIADERAKEKASEH
jgi:hypothetical protein